LATILDVHNARRYTLINSIIDKVLHTRKGMEERRERSVAQRDIL